MCVYKFRSIYNVYRLFRILLTASVILAVCFSNDLENILTVFGNVKNFLKLWSCSQVNARNKK